MTTLRRAAAAESSRPLRSDAVRNRALLIDAGRRAFAVRGLEASLDDVARLAGLGVGTAYRNFANKYELAKAILEQASAVLVAELESAMQTDDPWDGLVSFLNVVLQMQSDDRGLRDALTGVHEPHELSVLHERLLGHLELLLARAQRAEAVRQDATATDLGCILIMLINVSNLEHEVSHDLWQRYLPTLLNGLRPFGPDLPGNPLCPGELLVGCSHSGKRSEHRQNRDCAELETSDQPEEIQ